MVTKCYKEIYFKHTDEVIKIGRYPETRFRNCIKIY